MNAAHTQPLLSDVSLPVELPCPATSTTLERLARLAAQLCAAPTATIAGLDRRGRWHTAHHGPGADICANGFDWQAQVIAAGEPIVFEGLDADVHVDADSSQGSATAHPAGAVVPAFGTRDDVIGICGVFDRGPRTFTEEQIDGLRVLAAQAADAIHRSQLQDEITALQHRERAYHELLSATNEQALRDLSEELHEGISQDISGVAMLVAAAARRATCLDPNLAADLREIAELLKETIDSCRIAAEASDGFVITHSGLGSALMRVVDGLDIAPPRTCVIDLDNFREESVEFSTAYQLLRIAQEALLIATNQRNATLIRVSLRGAGAHVVLTVSDDSQAAASTASMRADDIGQPLMHFRAVAIGARLMYGHDQHQGYWLRVEVPVRRNSDRLSGINPWTPKHG